MESLINISSSESDSDFDFGSDEEPSTNVRAEGYGQQSGNLYSPQVAMGSSNRSLSLSPYSQIEDPRYRLSDADYFRSTTQRNISNSEYPKHSAEQLGKRALPSSFQPSSSSAAPHQYRNTERGHQINGSGRVYPLAGLSHLNDKSREKDIILRNNDNDVFMLDKGGTRILPPWQRASPISGRYASSIDPTDPFRISDERVGMTDERSVFQEVMQDLNQPKQELDLPQGLLTVPLLRHQKIALAWMRQKEARPFCVGGMLADDQGLGKTVSIIALIQMERHSEQKFKAEDHKVEALNLDDDDDDGIANLDDVKPIGDSNGTTATSNETSSHHASSNHNSSSQQASNKQRPAAGTLVVCPATVLRQWARELEEKVTEDAKLKVLVYHGSNRTKDPSNLATYDVVLTTYAIVTNEVPKQSLVDEDGTEHKNGEKYGLSTEFSRNEKRKKPSSSSKKGKKGKKGTDSSIFDNDAGALAKVRWQRVVLDEAQTIKNHRTLVARACCGLRAKKRWCLSGTPIQNAIDELFSYFRFLKYDPYSSFKAFCEGIKGPISRDSKSGYQKLQIVLRTVMLRRTKDTKINGQPIINLPPKKVHIRSKEFTLEERKFYSELEADTRKQFKAYADSGTVNQNYASILLMLLRLRQACDHPYLVCGSGSDSIRKKHSMQTLKQLPKDKLTNLLNRLQQSPICILCADPPEDAVITKCGHVFCDQCVTDHMIMDDDCPEPNCKAQLSTDAIFSKATLRICLSDGSESSQSNGDQHGETSSVTSQDYTSSKIRAALDILQSLGQTTPASIPCIDLDESADNDGSALGSVEANFQSSDPTINVRTETIHSGPSGGRQKTIIFSQWTRMLDLMEASLMRSEIQYRRLDGTMSLVARDRAVREFNSFPEVDVMLMSLKAGNLGLNMVAACHVILLDLWWNPTTEDQAIDRAHRIGQTREVTVSRLTIKDTVEDRILALQEEKRKMVASAFGEDGGGGSARLTAQDLRFLFMGV
ncbi:hypothetical protein V2J09_011566 [Rumex salicifolius]